MKSADCTFKSARYVGDPVDVVTGTVVGVDREFQLPGPFELLWRRYYDSRRYLEDAGCGLGFRFEYDRRLRFDLDGIRYTAPDGSEARMPELSADGQEWEGQGFRLTRIDELRYALAGGDQVAMLFAFDEPTHDAKLLRLSTDAHAVSLGYDERGRLATLADARGRSIRVMRDSLGRMQRVLLTDPEHGLNDKVAAEYAYDDAGRLTRTTDPYGHHLAYAYDKQGRLARFTDRNGYSFHYAYDAHGRCIHTHGDDGIEELRLAYDRDARFTTVTRGNGGQWQYFYDDNDALTRVIDPIGAVTEYQYEIDGTLVREIRPDKTIITYEHDETGFNNVNSLPTGEGVEPGAELDPFIAAQRRYRVHRTPLPARDLYVREPSTPMQWEHGRMLADETAHSLPVKTSRLEFLTDDEWQGLAREDQPGRGSPHAVRDAYGLLVREERHDGRGRHYHYDPNGNVARVTDFDGGVSRRDYASWNELVASSDPNGHTTLLRYDRDENLVALADPGGTVSEFAYDKSKNLTEVKRNGASRERYVNDSMGRPLERSGADGKVELRLTYDAEGLMASRKLASGDKQTFEYAALARLALCGSLAGKIELLPTYSGQNTVDLRDGKGLQHDLGWARTEITKILERFEVRYYRFDDDSTHMVVAPGGVVHRARRCGSGVVRRELHHGGGETTQFNSQGRVLRRLRTDAKGKRHDTLYTYSGEGDLLQVADSERGLTRYDYDAAHRLLRVHYPNGTTSDDYLYDEAGNLLHMPGLNYFALSPDEQALQIDPAVLRPSTHGVWLQGGNQLYRAHGERFVYNTRGHVAERQGLAHTLAYQYDELDQLVAIRSTSGSNATFRYDALGRRTRKQVGDAITEYYWSNDRLAAEVQPDGKLRIYIYADFDASLVPFSFVEYASVDAKPDSGKHYYYSCNHLGVPEVVRSQDGNIVWQATNDPYGLAVVEIGEDFHQPLRFPGHYFDVETGLHYNRYRYYVPSLGRYLQADPIDIEGGHNLYAYAQEGNPLRDVDLFGLACQISEALLAKALKDGIINDDGSPGKPLKDMTESQKQLFCAARAAQLANEMGHGTIQEGATTVNVAIVKRANGEREIVVTASTDNGNPPPVVREGMHGDGTDHGPPETSEPNFPKIKNTHEGKPHPDAAAAREEKGNRDGKVMSVNEDGKAKPVQKKNRDNPKGSTEHHAEQRTQNNLNDGDKIEAMAPSKKCCDGCQKALSKSGNDKKVPKDLGGQGKKLIKP